MKVGVVGGAAVAGAVAVAGAGAGGARPCRERARYAVAPVLLATRIFYTPHIIDIVVMFCYDAKKSSLIQLQVCIYTDFEPLFIPRTKSFRLTSASILIIYTYLLLTAFSAKLLHESDYIGF